MTYQELINNIKSLGFSDDAEMEEFAESGVLYDSINRAITRINLEVSPILEKYEFDVKGTDEGYLYIDMTDVDDLFLDFADTPVTYAETVPYTEDGVVKKKETPLYHKFNDYDIETENTIVINADSLNRGVSGADEMKANHSYSFRIFYKIQHETFKGSAAELRSELPLQLKVHHLVPLLASYYVWMEDEPTKAAQYYNMFESEKVEIRERSQENKIKIRVLSGGM